MSAECPRCKNILFMKVESIQIFAVDEVNFFDVKVLEHVDQSRSYQLFCPNCEFQGWLDEYHNEKEGITSIFNEEGGLQCDCYLKQQKKS